MSALRQYTPRLDFTPLKAPAQDAAAENAPPSLSEEEVTRLIDLAVEEARKAAFAEGEEAGRNAAEASLAASNAAAMAVIKRQLGDILAAQDAILREVEIRAVRLILSVAQKVAFSLSETEMESFSVGVARRALETARGSSKITFRVSESIGEAMFQSLSSVLSGEIGEGRIAIERDASLPPAGVDVRWDNGAVAFDPEALAKSVNDVLSRTLRKLSDASETGQPFKEAAYERSDEQF